MQRTFLVQGTGAGNEENDDLFVPRRHHHDTNHRGTL
jgi:hypothetical protein